MSHSSTDDGNRVDFGITMLQLYYTVMLVFNLKVTLALLGRGVKAGLISMPVSFALLFIYIYFNNNDGHNK